MGGVSGLCACLYPSFPHVRCHARHRSDAGTRPRICVNMGTSAAIRVCLSCNDRRYRSKSSGDGDKGAAHGQEGSRKAAKLNDEDTALPAGLFRFSMKRDLMLVGGSLAELCQQ